MCCSYCMMGTCGNVQGLIARVYVVNGVEIFVSSAFLLLFPFHFCLPFLLSLSPFPSLSPSLLIFSLFLPLPLSLSLFLPLPPLSLSSAVMCPPPPQPGSNSKICSFSDSGRIIDNIDDGSGYGPLITPGYLPPPEEVRK